MLDSSPAVRACRDGRGYHVARDRSSGGLRVVPSAVAGLEIDTAAWSTYARINGIGVSSDLILTARIRAERQAGVEGVALIYRLSDGSTAIVDALLNPPIFTANAEERSAWNGDVSDRPQELKAAQTLRTERTVDLDAVLYSGRSAPLKACPTSVQLVPRTSLALHLGSGRAWRSRQSAAAGSASGPADARVVWDTIVDVGLNSLVVAGLVANPSGDTLKDRVATLALSPHMLSPRGPGDAPQPSGEPPDTLEYALEPLVPGGVAGFAGGTLEYGESIVSRSIRTLSPREEWSGKPADPRSNPWVRRSRNSGAVITVSMSPRGRAPRRAGKNPAPIPRDRSAAIERT